MKKIKETFSKQISYFIKVENYKLFFYEDDVMEIYVNNNYYKRIRIGNSEVKIKNHYISYDKNIISLIYNNNKCFFFDCKNGNEFQETKFMVKDFNWINKDYDFLVLDELNKIYQGKYDQLNEEMVFVIDIGFNVYSIRYFKSMILIFTEFGLYLYNENKEIKRLMENKVFSSTCNEDNLYAIGENGVYQIDLKTFKQKYCITKDICFSRYETRYDELLHNCPILLYENYLFICFNNFIECFLVNYNFIYDFDSEFHDKIIDIFIEDDNINILNPKEIYSILLKKDNNDIKNQIISIYKESDNIAFRFVEFITILQKNPNLDSILLPFLVEQYSLLPENQLTEMTPLLLYSIKSCNTLFPFKELYNILSKNGKDFEIWRFIAAYDITNEPLSLQLFEECKLNFEQVTVLINKFGIENVDVIKLINTFPNISPILFEEKNNYFIIPFIIDNNDKLSEEARERFKSQMSSCGLFSNELDNNIDLDNISFYKTPFYILEMAKRKGDWKLATSISEKIEIESEYMECKSKVHNPENNAAFDFNEQNGIFNDIIRKFKNNSMCNFEYFHEESKSICNKLDSEMKYITTQKESETRNINELLKKKLIFDKMNQNINKNSLCDYCHDKLGKNKIVYFSCSHVFHKLCLKKIYMDIEQEQKKMFREIHTDGCPICQLHSSTLIHSSLVPTHKEWNIELES